MPVVMVLMTAACTVSSHRLLGPVHSPKRPDDVQVYLEPLKSTYQEIAEIDTSSRCSMAFTANGKAEVVIKRLQEEAAKLGANGLLLQEISDDRTAGAGAALAPDVTRDHATLGVGVNASGLLASRFGRGLAIYVIPDARNRGSTTMRRRTDPPS